jgi:hypothetical protein
VCIYIHCITYRLKRKAATFVPYETNPPIPMNSVFFTEYYDPVQCIYILYVQYDVANKFGGFI